MVKQSSYNLIFDSPDQEEDNLKINNNNYYYYFTKIDYLLNTIPHVITKWNQNSKFVMHPNMGNYILEFNWDSMEWRIFREVVTIGRG